MSHYVQTSQSFDAQFALPLNRQGPAWEGRENPQFYDELESQVVSPTPRRQMLGLVGGNEVATVAASRVNVVNGQQADVESDLKGITRVNTKAPWRKYQPQVPGDTVIKRSGPKGEFRVDAKQFELAPMQMWAYPAAYQPEPMVKETCGRPEKY